VLVEVAGAGTSSLPQPPLILALQRGLGQNEHHPSPALERSDD